MAEQLFSIERDNELIAAGTHFWCEACLIACPLDIQSPDPRYCQSCYNFLLKEAEMITGRPSWVPRPQKSGGENLVKVSQPINKIMSTLEAEKNKVDIIPPSVGKVPRKKRGPKHKILPEAIIRQLSAQGFGSKAISTRLKRAQGIEVSYKTIQRILTGQRG